MMESVASVAQAVSGMSVAEASAALGGESYSMNGLTEILSFPMNNTKGGTQLSMQAMYASELWDYWKTMAAGAGITSLGAAAAAVKSWASGVLFGDAATAGTLAGAGGLLTMSLPAVAAAAAPVLGVSLGATLYSANPEFWEKISRALLPWAYKDTNTMPVVVDGNGQVYMPEEALRALKELFDEDIYFENDVWGKDGAVSVGDYTFSGPIRFTIIGPGQERAIGISTYGGEISIRNNRSQGNLYVSAVSPVDYALGADLVQGGHYTRYARDSGGNVISESIFTLVNKYTYDDRTLWVTGAEHEYVSTLFSKIYSILGVQITNAACSALEWFMAFGSSESQQKIPEGTSKWNGDSTDLDNTPKKYVVTSSDGYTKPYFPITLPIGDPTISPDPALQPDPTAPVEIPQLDPYIAPEPAPEMWPEIPDEPYVDPSKKIAPQYEKDPTYVPKPDLDPEDDPSQEPDPEEEPADETPPPPPPPPPSGTTPSVIWPPVNFPSVVPSSGSGLVHVYNPTPSQLIDFGDWLWVTYADPDITKLWNNPFDGIIGAHEIYVTPSRDASDTIKSGFLDSGITSTVVRQRYVSINCGSMVIPEYYGNYLDYSPYSKAFVYLPFIGIVEVDVDDIVGHSVNILYHIDTYNGSCIAQITIAKDNYVNTAYQFSGNCAVDIPLAGGSQAAIRAGMISAAAYGIGSTVNGVINGAALGSIGGLAGAALGGVTGAIGSVGAGVANVVSQKSTVQHSGSFGSSYGAMGIKTPYIIIRRPVQKFVPGYQNDYGFPAYVRVTIGSCTGYLRVREVNVQSTLATDDEKTLIENLLKSGVYIT